MKNQIITELYGVPLQDRNNRGGARVPDNIRSAIGISGDRTIQNPEYSTIGKNILPNLRSWKANTNFMSPWQMAIMSKMWKESLIISVPPAAGKSKPFQTAFFSKLDDDLSQIRHSNDVIRYFLKKDSKKLVYIAPTRQLVNEFYGDISTILMEIIIKHSNIFGISLKYDHNRSFTFETMNSIYKLLKQLTSLQEGGFNEKSLTTREFGDNIIKISPGYIVKPILIGTYDGGVQGFLKNSSHFNFILLDELQEFLIHPGATEYDEKKLGWLIRLIKYAKKEAKIHLMTGSVNVESLETLTDSIELKTGRKFLIQNVTKSSFLGREHDAKAKKDNAQNRSDLIVVGYNKLSDIDERIKLIKNAVINKTPYNIMISFSTLKTRVNGIFYLLEKLIEVLPKRNPDVLFSGYKSLNLLNDQHDPSKPTTIHNKWYEKFFSIQKDFTQRNPLKESIIDEFKIPNVEYRGDLKFRLTNFQLYEYEAELTDGRFFNSEVGNYILAKINPSKYYETKQKDVLHGILFEIKEINPDYTITCIFKGSTIPIDEYSKEGNKLKNNKMDFYSNYTIDADRWLLLDKEVDDVLNISDLKDVVNDIDIQKEYGKNIGRFGERNVIVNDIEFLKYFNEEPLFRPKSEDGKPVSSEELINKYDENNILYQGILCGIGVMTGKLHNRHKNIIQSLFRQGKIYFLLATDALGVGANVLCRRVYIPTMTKFGDQEFKKVDDSSLVQLINRVGRTNSKIPQGYVFVNSEDFDRAKDYIEKEPSFAINKLSISFQREFRDMFDDVRKNDDEEEGVNMN